MTGSHKRAICVLESFHLAVFSPIICIRHGKAKQNEICNLPNGKDKLKIRQHWEKEKHSEIEIGNFRLDKLFFVNQRQCDHLLMYLPQFLTHCTSRLGHRPTCKTGLAVDLSKSIAVNRTIHHQGAFLLR